MSNPASLVSEYNLPLIPPLARTWVVRAYLAEARYEFIRMLRNPGFAIPFLLLPTALYLFFAGVIFGGLKEPKVAIQIFTGFDITGVMGPAIFGFGMIVAVEREQGLLTLKRALPMPPAAYLLAKVVMAMLFNAIITVGMIVASQALGQVRLTVREGLSLALINIFAAVPMCAIGLLVGTLATARSAPAFTNVIYLAMVYLSGLLFPIPPGIRTAVYLSPAYHLDQLALAAVGIPDTGSILVHSAVLGGVTLLFLLPALHRLARRA